MRHLIVRTAALASAAILLAACGTTEPSTNESRSPLEEAAFLAAQEIVGDQELDGTITILGSLGGDQMDQFMSAFAPFEEVSGVDVRYEGTRDMLSVLETRVQGGNPPDLVTNPSIGQMRQLMASGDLIQLDPILDMATVRRDYDAGLLELGSHDGTLYGIMDTAAVKGLVYYDPAHYTGPVDAAAWADLDQWALGQAAAGQTPWCIGLESGAASGWPATDWIEQFMLTGYGVEVWDQWAASELPWTSPEVRAAFEQFGRIATDAAMVNGGPTTVASTDFIKAALPLWSDPPRCELTLQADWLTATAVAEVPGIAEGTDVDFFLFPPLDPAQPGLVETSGEMLGAFTDTPEVRALLQFLVTAESQALISATGQWLSANKSVPADAYPTQSRQKAAGILASATAVRFDASDLMPQAVNQAFWSASLTYVNDPSKLDEVLETLEQARLDNL
ncbi:MAG: ABC transporter substrate-binding protein [Bifidobacteriaceae bacterium]|jgi:alpha-glucoside transport system substrate-binding protein|nr:ABC transporter substrate-binding protein [Bifidobacteriaceae bacterium]